MIKSNELNILQKTNRTSVISYNFVNETALSTGLVFTHLEERCLHHDS